MNLSRKKVLLTISLVGIALILWLQSAFPWLNSPIPRVYPLTGEVRTLLIVDVPKRFYQSGWSDFTKYRMRNDFPVLPNEKDIEARGSFLLGSLEVQVFVLTNEQAAKDYLQQGIAFLNEAFENKGPQATLTSHELYEEPDLGDENLVYFNYNSRDMINPDAIQYMIFIKRCQVVWFLNVIDYDPQQSEEVIALDISRQLDQRAQQSSWCE